MTIDRITLTGADERTDIGELERMAREFPALEIGLLYSGTPEGRSRYPSPKWLLAAASRLQGRVAIHICGREARRALIDGELGSLVSLANRVQVNGHLRPDELVTTASRVGTVITQHTASNAPLLHVAVTNHELLIDGSGGRGISPTHWPRVATNKPVGRAGGMGPDNLARELADFAATARPGAWVDMEGRLRTNDWFDLSKARACLEIFAGFSAREAAPPAAPASGAAAAA